jgi:hypothetical protein
LKRGLSNTTRPPKILHQPQTTFFNLNPSLFNKTNSGEQQKMTKPRKYKAKPPISQLDDAAAQHRRAQSCKAQRAYRQRKEDTIATLTTQISDLETTIERLSGCFLGLNDTVLAYLRTIEGDNEQGSAGLAKGIRDAMKEFKQIIESGDGEGKQGNCDEMGILEQKGTGYSSPTAQQFYPSPPASSGYEIPLQQHQPEKVIPAASSFSGPAFFGLTPTTLPLHLPSTLTSSEITQNHHALAARLYHTTIAKSFTIVYTPGPPSAIFRRVFAVFFTGLPDEQVKQQVTDMMDQRLVWSCFDKVAGSARGWWSALQVAGFISAQGGWFDKEQDRLLLKTREGVVSVGVEGLLEGEFEMFVQGRWRC